MNESGPPITARAGWVSISPDIACEMGCGPTSCPTLDSRDPIEANVIVLGCGSSRVVLVSVDALYVGRVVSQAVVDGLRPWVAPEAVFLFASHSHTAPMLDSDKPALGRADPKHLVEVSRRIVRLVSELMESAGEEVKLEHGSCAAQFAVCRRRRRFLSMSHTRSFQFNKAVMSPNVTATRPQIGNVVVLSGCQGPIAIIWSIPCHPSALKVTRFSADFPGYIRNRFRDQFNRALPVVFLQGFSGDLRPLAMRPVVTLKECLLRVLMGPRLGEFGETAYEDWLHHMWTEISTLTDKLHAVSAKGGIRVRRVERPLTDFATPASVAAVRSATVIGQWLGVGELEILGLSAEPVSEWEQRVRAISPGRRIITAGCLGDVFWYAPIHSMLSEGGYEVAGFCPPFGLVGLRSGFDAAMTGLLQEILMQESPISAQSK